jgi:hypothetical protein
MFVRWDAELSYKAYHDPQTDRVAIVSSGVGGEGEMLALGGDEPDLALLCEPDGCCSLLELERARAGSRDEHAGVRPADCPTALEAEVEIQDGARLGWCFEAGAGTLWVRVAGVDAVQWARVGPNLLWLAIDDDAHLAALVFEGVSRDPGGKAQSAWLSEMNAG